MRLHEVKGIDRRILRAARNPVQLRLALESIEALPYLQEFLRKKIALESGEEQNAHSTDGSAQSDGGEKQ